MIHSYYLAAPVGQESNTVELGLLLGVSCDCSQGVGLGWGLISGMGPRPSSHWFLAECTVLQLRSRGWQLASLRPTGESAATDSLVFECRRWGDIPSPLPQGIT